MGKAYEKVYEVTYGETDGRKDCRITSMMNFFSDCCLSQEEKNSMNYAGNSSETTWVFFDYEIIVNRYPRYREKVKVKTYVESIRKFYSNRVLEAYDMDGALVARADVLAFLINKKTRRPARISDEEYEIHGLSKESSKLLRKKLKFEKFDKEDLEMKFHIRYLDIDLNMHVSNIKYVEWILETVPVDIVLNYKMKKIKIKFEKEITYGHNVIIKSKIIKGEDEVKVLHKVENEEGESITLAETYWY
ncbi:thioesterase [Clostridium perfringens]|uniref:acyl-[acyl-carrier-protein] thioesterase n=1 Tax=Clostridium perfringens TaxID=1502 RepID=UPI0010F363F9|nr:acyl-ACP thioesterase domain-containing protein [Clostridium perfringens]MDM0447614.1 thioesterase [Clostridium perfringens]MDM0452008.1 thioesterase [Clostridium perfringens]CAG9367111.1 acyl-ACP thioesterase [Clostridium perfringens]VTR84811.1 acyl-ACP thioesterase [Clostridium perfringens]HAT4265156.1 acyl-ACP thioesterase [Clostridium perfringens]